MCAELQTLMLYTSEETVCMSFCPHRPLFSVKICHLVTHSDLIFFLCITDEAQIRVVQPPGRGIYIIYVLLLSEVGKSIFPFVSEHIINDSCVFTCKSQQKNTSYRQEFFVSMYGN